jgi:hypothetical protein
MGRYDLPESSGQFPELILWLIAGAIVVGVLVAFRDIVREGGLLAVFGVGLNFLGLYLMFGLMSEGRKAMGISICLAMTFLGLAFLGAGLRGRRRH